MGNRAEEYTAAAEACDGLGEIFSALAARIADAARRGGDLIDWTTARALWKQLGTLLPDSSLWIGAGARERITLADIMPDPRSGDWDMIQVAVRTAAEQVQRVRIELSRELQKFSARPFVRETVESLRAREGALERLLALDPPQAVGELAALKRFLPRLVTLLARIADLCAAVDAYVARLRADGKWPIRGD
jgi:hypothetical protein